MSCNRKYGQRTHKSRVKLRKHRDKRTISGDRKRGARTSLPSPVGCFSTSASYCNLYIIIDAFRHHELHFQSQIIILTCTCLRVVSGRILSKGFRPLLRPDGWDKPGSATGGIGEYGDIFGPVNVFRHHEFQWNLEGT